MSECNDSRVGTFRIDVLARFHLEWGFLLFLATPKPWPALADGDAMTSICC